jgi:hypothetical protein
MHFTTKDYDYIKYNGKLRITGDQFERRKDKYFFHKLAKRKDVKEFLIANFVSGNNQIWIGDLVNNSSTEENYTQWKKRTQALAYMFEEDLKKCLTNLDDNVIIKDNQHPFMLKLFLRKKISIETLLILNDLTGFFSHWNKHLKDDIIWKDVHLVCVKYRPFLNYDKAKMKATALKIFSSESEAA